MGASHIVPLGSFALRCIVLCCVVLRCIALCCVGEAEELEGRVRNESAYLYLVFGIYPE